jgi:hypothetical protein
MANDLSSFNLVGVAHSDPANALRPTTKQLHRIHELIAQSESLAYSLPMASDERQDPAVFCLFEAAMGDLHAAVKLLRRATGETTTLWQPMPGEFAGQLSGNLERAETPLSPEVLNELTDWQANELVRSSRRNLDRAETPVRRETEETPSPDTPSSST